MSPGIGRLAQTVTVDHHDGIGAQHEGVGDAPGDGAGLGPGQGLGRRPVIAGRQLFGDPARQHPEVRAEPPEELPPARRLRGQDEQAGARDAGG
jgi:hypothetical protein